MTRILHNTVHILAVAFALLGAVGCTSGPVSWRESRRVGDRFFVVETLKGAEGRAIPVERSFVDADAEEQWPPLGEPHGSRMMVRAAHVYLMENGDRSRVKSYRRFVRDGQRHYENVRLWPSPNGRKLAVQRVWRDRPIEIIDAEGKVRPLPDEATEGIEPTYHEYPFGFVQWADEGRTLALVSIHTPQARGYTFVVKWRVDTQTGEREKVSETLLLLSDQVADWKLVPIPIEPSLNEVAEILRGFERHQEDWVRRTALENLERVLARMARGEE